MRTPAAILLAAISGSLVLAPTTAHAQNRLGDGTGQQRDTSRYGRARPPLTRDINAELRLRNAIITGNVPGSSFRGEVGYTAPFEFRGETGSDDLFAFRRDSIYSGLAGAGIRGTDALQYQFGLSTGLRPSQNLVGSLSLSRSFAGASAGRLDQNGRNQNGVNGNTEALRFRALGDPDRDTRGERLRELRSTSSYLTNRSLSTELLGRRALDTGDSLEITAGGLSGVRFDIRRQQRERSAFEAPRNVTSRSANTLDAGARRVSDVYERLRESLSASIPVDQTGAPDPEGTAAAAPRDPGAVLDEQLNRLRDALDPARRDDAPEEISFDEQMMDLLRGSELRLEAYAEGASAQGRDIYREHLRDAQRHLTEGRYFDAEARFTAALGLLPADPIALAGRVHAQAGAGMLTSAATNLRSLMAEHPELASTRYTEELMPKRERLEQIVELIDQRAGVMEAQLADLLLLRAYLGYHLNDRGVVDGSFARLAQLRDDLEQPRDPVDQFTREIWAAR